MFKKINILLAFVISSFSCQGQVIPKDKPVLTNQAFEAEVSSLLNFSVPTISVEELSKQGLENFLLLDARGKKEFETSHIQGAEYAGFWDFDLRNWKNVDKEQPIVVYCSVGYRSEKIGEKFKKAGFKNVYNLYGSIFEWINQGNPIEKNGTETKEIHTYNKKWSQWVNNPNYQKTW
ncbi:MAG: rhodanese-like domain-containing protein [Saprospiraceae bacterium]